jgi:hypothetical protein
VLRLNFDSFLAFQHKQKREMSRRVNMTRGQMTRKWIKSAEEQILAGSVDSVTKGRKIQRTISVQLTRTCQSCTHLQCTVIGKYM